jgi:hypothetical protein
LFIQKKLRSIIIKHLNVTFTANSLTLLKFEGLNLNVTFHDLTHLKNIVPPDLVSDSGDEKLEMGSVMVSVRKFFPRRGQPPPSLAESQDPPAQSVEDDHLVEFLIEAF